MTTAATVGSTTAPVLIVDDHAATRLGMASVLAPLGHEIVEAASGLEALRCVAVRDFAVILLNLGMPDMDGFETATLIRSRRQSECTPIIFHSAHVSGEVDTSRLYAHGTVDFISTPFRREELQAKVSVFANLFVRTQLLAEWTEELTRERSALAGVNQALTAVSRSDPLTGLGNRRALEEDLDRLESRVLRYGHRYCMALIDLDHFKAYNDAYGHQAGDDVLATVAGEFAHHTRSGDSLYRYGGEEFLCILPEQSAETGSRAIQRMRRAVERLRIDHAGNPGGVVTISAGLAVLDAHGAESAVQLLGRADEALYRAKGAGRNRVEHALVPAAAGALNAEGLAGD